MLSSTLRGHGPLDGCARPRPLDSLRSGGWTTHPSGAPIPTARPLVARGDDGGVGVCTDRSRRGGCGVARALVAGAGDETAGYEYPTYRSLWRPT